MLSVLAVPVLSAALAVPQWISGDTKAAEKPAPVLTRTFVLKDVPREARIELAVAGWCEIRVNGRKAGDDVLEPVTGQPDRRIPILTKDVTDLLKPGENTVEVLLGNGWFNMFTITTWKFTDGSWQDSPQIRGRIVADGRTLLVTDGDWRAYDSPIVFNALRNGEYYDARLEGVRPHERPAQVEKYGPAGETSPAVASPCRAFETFAPVRVFKAADGDDIYDFGANISGWCEIDMKGAAGAKLVFEYDETVTNGNCLLRHVCKHVEGRGDPRKAQHDEYTLAGRAEGETWHPRFTCHGFRYVKVSRCGEAAVTAIRARFVHSAFAKAGTVTTSDPDFTALQAATERSYLSNFTGFPTDCPHREKNGWTGDAQLAAETGLWNYDAKDSYVHYLRMVVDAQRPNGAIPCIVPCSQSFGYGWGTGPAWDAVLFELPWQIHRFTGDDGAAKLAWPAMRKYLAYIAGKADADGLYAFGLGDWCAPTDELSDTPDDPRAALRVTDSAYVYSFFRQAAFWARRFGEASLASDYDATADAIARAFNKAFYRGDGLYATGHWTELAAPLYFKGLCQPSAEQAVVGRLVASVRAARHRAQFGILGAKWVTRVLSDYGYIDDAWRIFTQKERPGWMHWLTFGDGTLREMWNDRASHNHIMFGDLSAWAYEYVGGIVPLEPGFRKVALRPHFPKGVASFAVTHRTPFGEIRVAWRQANGRPEVETSVPPGVEVVR